jgi:opacity protein-like surface antigen
MRCKSIFAVILPAFLILIAASRLCAQVAPAAKVNGIPFVISIGMSDYNLDYGPGRRMQGPVIRAGSELFHGLGVDFDARAIFMDTPSQLTRMQQNTFLVGGFYDTPALWKIHPFVRFGYGLGTIEFPSNNPKYTRDSYTVYAPSGGFEFPIVRKVYFRAEYEYQFWEDFQSRGDLNPQGGTVGVSYYLGGRHLRPHPVD